jgi:hypothetical protein
MIRNNKCQASLEYLTTYGWALLIIFLVIGVLSTFLLNGATTVALDCYFGDHFFCTEASYNSSGDALDLVLKNTESTVIVDGIDIIVKDGDCEVTQNDVRLSNIWQNDTVFVGQATGVGYEWLASQRKIISITCDTAGRFLFDVSIKFKEKSGVFDKSLTGTVRGEWKS